VAFTRAAFAGRQMFPSHAWNVTSISSVCAPAGASAVIYGGVDARGIAYEGVAHALEVPNSDLRLFGKPEAYRTRRMGVALATAPTVDEARDRAKECARRVRPTA